MTSPPLRILIVSRALPGHVNGGLEFHTYDLVRALADEGVKVDLLTSRATPDDKQTLSDKGIRLHEIDIADPRRYSLQYLRSVVPILDRLAHSAEYDVIHGQEFGFGFWRPPSEIKSKIVVSVHGTITSETPLHRDVFPDLSPPAKLKAIARFGRRFLFASAWKRQLERADAILVDSDFTKNELNRLQPTLSSRVRKIQLGVDLSRYPTVVRAEAKKRLGWTNHSEFILLTIGRLEWQKGHDITLRALGQIKSLGWRYVIAGEGSATDSLVALASDLKLKDRVQFVGRVDAETKSNMLAAADLFIWPERTHPAFGLVGLEAILAGLPLIASNRGAIPEMTANARATLFDPRDENELSKSLASSIDALPHYSPPSAPPPDAIRSLFSAKRMARQVLGIYRDFASPGD